MTVIATRENADGTFDNVGTTNRRVVPESLKTERGIKNRLLRTGWAKPGQRVRLEKFCPVAEFCGGPHRTMIVTSYI